MGTPRGAEVTVTSLKAYLEARLASFLPEAPADCVRQAAYELLMPHYRQCFRATGSQSVPPFGAPSPSSGFGPATPMGTQPVPPSKQAKEEAAARAGTTEMLLCSFPVAVVTKLLITAFKT
jgi:hypothetical protein